jgi:hypothetical protein
MNLLVALLLNRSDDTGGEVMIRDELLSVVWLVCVPAKHVLN